MSDLSAKKDIFKREYGGLRGICEASNGRLVFSSVSPTVEQVSLSITRKIASKVVRSALSAVVMVADEAQCLPREKARTTNKHISFRVESAIKEAVGKLRQTGGAMSVDKDRKSDG